MITEIILANVLLITSQEEREREKIRIQHREYFMLKLKFKFKYSSKFFKVIFIITRDNLISVII